MFGLGMTEIIVILVIALLIFGPSKLPELARSLGRGFGEFRRASYDLRQSLMEATEPEPPPRPRPPSAETMKQPAATPPAPGQPEQAEASVRESAPAPRGAAAPGGPGGPAQG